MADPFDPYHKWLAIPPEEQPANHYRLLSLPLFETDPEVIQHAADRQMAHLRTFQAGRFGPLSQKLLNEVARAKICLLNPEKRAAYDAQLHRLLDAASAGEDTSSHQQLLAELGRMAAEDAHRAGGKRDRRGTPLGTIAAGTTAVLVAAAAVAWWSLVGQRRAAPVASPPRVAQSEAARAPAPEPKRPARPSPVEAVSHAKPEPEQARRSAPRPPEPKPKRFPPKPVPRAAPPEPAVATAPSPPPTPLSPAEPARLPVPAQAAQDQAMKIAQDIYRTEYEQAKGPAQQQALAGTILQQARSPELPPTDRFVLLRLARDVAVQAGDCALAFEAAEGLVERFEMNGLATKAELLDALSRSARMQAGHKAVAERAIELAEAALAADSLPLAEKSAKTAVAEAGKARDKELVLRARTLIKDIQDAGRAWAAADAARSRLEQNPGDPDANLAVARYLCFAKGDWRGGLPLLARGSDKRLAGAAVRELTLAKGHARPKAEDALTLGETWWELAGQSPQSERTAIRVHAAAWYKAAKDDLTEPLAAVKIDKRLAELAALARPIPDLYPPKLLVNSLGMRLVLIPAGEFEMGTTGAEIELMRKEGSTSSLDHETPRHQVRITRPFYLGAFEVTQAEYATVMNSNPSKFQDVRRPVENLTWDQAVEFCRRLSQTPKERAAGRVYRLPTEAEWEYACRAGTTTLWFFGDDPALLGQYAWHLENSGNRSQEVGRKKPNPWGLYDILGNLTEWCADFAGPHYYASSPEADPTGPKEGAGHVVRGGTFLVKAGGVRPALRNSYHLAFRYSTIGFRVACVAEKKGEH